MEKPVPTVAAAVVSCRVESCGSYTVSPHAEPRWGPILLPTLGLGWTALARDLVCASVRSCWRTASCGLPPYLGAARGITTKKKKKDSQATDATLPPPGCEAGERRHT